MTSTYRVFSTRNGRTAFARVTVELRDPEPGVGCDQVSCGADAYQAWQGAACAGARFALFAARSTAVVEVTLVEGTHVDTTARAVAAAACRATWAALQFQPPRELDERVEQAPHEREWGIHGVPEIFLTGATR